MRKYKKLLERDEILIVKFIKMTFSEYMNTLPDLKKEAIEFDPIKERVDMLRLVNPGLEDIPDEVIIQEITSTDRMIRFHLPSKDGRTGTQPYSVHLSTTVALT